MDQWVTVLVQAWGPQRRHWNSLHCEPLASTRVLWHIHSCDWHACTLASTHVPMIDMHAPLRIPCCALEHLKRHSCLFLLPALHGRRSCTVYVVFTPGKVAHWYWLWQCALAPCLIGYCKCLSHCKEQMCSSPLQSLSQDFVTLIKIRLKARHGGACLWSQHAGGWDSCEFEISLCTQWEPISTSPCTKIHYFPSFNVRCS